MPKVNVVLLQRAVAEAEEQGPADFDALCKLMAGSDYCQKRNIDADEIGRLIVKHKVMVQVEAPTLDELRKSKPKPPKSDTRKDDTPKEITTYDEGGRGRKECPSCKKFLGNRNTVCACGHEFNKSTPAPKPSGPKASKPPQVTVPQTVQTGSNGRLKFPGRPYPRTWVPAGAPYHKLEGTDIEQVEAWAEKCRRTGLEEHRHWLTANALLYWVGMTYYSSVGTPTERKNHELVKSHLAALYVGEELDG